MSSAPLAPSRMDPAAQRPVVSAVSRAILEPVSEVTHPIPPPGLARSGLVLLGWLALSFSAAALGSLFLPGEWYARLQKPSWNPPNWIFGPVWTALYVMMAVAAWLVWKRGGVTTQRLPLTLFLVQLLFNALWSPLFFGLKNPGLALFNIGLLWLTLLATIVTFGKARLIAGVLLVPYLAWVTFASVLNFALWQLNP